MPHILELLQLSSHKEFPRVGLRISFPHALCPFAYICQNQNQDYQVGISVLSYFSISKQLIVLFFPHIHITYSIQMQMQLQMQVSPYLLYTLTVSGVAYLFKLRNVSAYSSLSAFPRDEFMQFNLQEYSNNASITSVAAAAGCLVVGRNDGSVACFQLGSLHAAAPGMYAIILLSSTYYIFILFFFFAPFVDISLHFFLLLGFVHELRDDSGIGRLWGFMSRYQLFFWNLFRYMRNFCCVILYAHAHLMYQKEK